MNECPQCETVWEHGRFCPDCLYHLPGPSLRERIRAWLHRAALTAGGVAESSVPARVVSDCGDDRRNTDERRTTLGSRSLYVPPAVSVVVPSSGGES